MNRTLVTIFVLSFAIFSFAPHYSVGADNPSPVRKLKSKKRAKGKNKSNRATASTKSSSSKSSAPSNLPESPPPSQPEN